MLLKKIIISIFFVYANVSFAGFSDNPDLKKVPVKMLNEALDYYRLNLNKIKNKDVIAIINFKEHNSKERLFLIDMNTGDVDSYLVAHGKNSDKNFDGYADSFSNNINSLQSSLGFYLTAETYYGDNGFSLRLDGLSTTNSNARDRAIVIHGADYVSPGTKIGRSYGCPAVEQRYHQLIIDRIKDGSLIYASF
jgi:hypothetical protein